jgi:hypothetical protein
MASVLGPHMASIAGRPAKRSDTRQKRLPERQLATPQCEIGFRRGFHS